MKRKPQNSRYALNHAASVRRRIAREPTWGEVADAYDAAVQHVLGLDARKRQQLITYMRALRVVNAVRAIEGMNV